MRARIHRGAREIGGNCVELESQGQRIVLDMGRPLDAAPDAQLDLPAINGLRETGAGRAPAVIISHPHLDHWGLAPSLPAHVPLYIGKAAYKILHEAAFFMRLPKLHEPTGYLDGRQTFEIGPFRVTPFLMDHSAFDSYALLIEADGRKLFYSGDLRAHGRKHKLFDQLLANAPVDLDLLLMEGTLVSPSPETDRRGYESEEAVQEAMEQVFADAPGIVLVCYSPQNIDRYVSVFKAARKAKRDFVIDLYGATIAAATGNEKIPVPGWPGVRVFVPRIQRIQVKKAKEFDRVDTLPKRCRLFPKDLAPRSNHLVMTFRQSMASDLVQAGCLAGATAIWSMWEGYLARPSCKSTLEFFEKHDIKCRTIHTSGHAFIPDLQRLVKAFHPKRVVPIHTSAPNRFRELFSGVAVEIRHDGEWWNV